MTVNDALMREADIYLSASLEGNAWNHAEQHDRQRALTSAERQLSVALRGIRVPEDMMKNAVFEQASYLLDADMQSAARTRQKGIQSVSIGHASESYRDIIPTERNGIVLSPIAYSILQPYLGSRQIRHGRLVP